MIFYVDILDTEVFRKSITTISPKNHKAGNLATLGLDLLQYILYIAMPKDCKKWPQYLALRQINSRIYTIK